MGYFDQNEVVRRKQRAIVKKNHFADPSVQYCDACLFEIFEYEEHQCSTSLSLYHRDTNRKRRQHPEMLKILQDRRNLS